MTAPAGGGKSHLLRRVLADVEMKVAAGVAFPPLGSRPLDPLRALLAGLGAAEDRDSEDQIADPLALAASRRARIEPSAIVVDDVHWASREEVASLARAIAGSEHAVPLAWILSARTAALPALSSLVDLADLRVELPALEPVDLARLVARRLGDVPDTVGAHIALGAERGNPLYLEHLSEAIREGCSNGTLPRSLHEAVLSRLDVMVERSRRLRRWSHSISARGEVEALEREVGDWLDRLETSDIADRATIGRYLARLRAVDVDLVVARSVLRMPVAANRRLGWAVERLAAGSTDGLLDYLETVARDGEATRAASEARTAAERAQRTLRLADAARLLAFASAYDESPALARQRGDLALASVARRMRSRHIAQPRTVAMMTLSYSGERLGLRRCSVECTTRARASRCCYSDRTSSQSSRAVLVSIWLGFTDCRLPPQAASRREASREPSPGPGRANPKPRVRRSEASCWPVNRSRARPNWSRPPRCPISHDSP